MEFLTMILQPILGTALQGLAVGGLAVGIGYLKKKTGLEISMGTQAKMAEAAKQAVLAVEEMATAHLKQGVGQLTPEEKHGQAVAMLKKQVPEVAGDLADELISSAVAMIPGVGATGVLGETGKER